MNIQSLGSDGPLKGRTIQGIRLLGSKDKIRLKQASGGLKVTPPAQKIGEFAYVFRIDLQ